MSRLLAFEVGPIRPPSEARSLLIRITRNCHWNRCSFCPVYKNKEFSVRPVDEILSDIDLLDKHLSNIRATFSSPLDVTSDKVWSLTQKVEPIELVAFDYALKWFNDGMQSVFLQDADALIIGATNLANVLSHLRNRFPWIERITTYSRSSTILKVGEDGLKELKDAGLNRVHVGLESGSDEVLKIAKKGASKAMHIKAGIMIKSANLELSEYIMPGLGGKRLSEVHAKESADALNQIDPDFIRLRPLALTDRAPLYSDFESGKFVKCNDIDIAQELIMFIEDLEGINSMVVSDHILNLFADLEGKLPDGKKHMLSILHAFLEMDSEKQILYRLGRRLGLFNHLKDMDDIRKMDRVLQIAVDEGISSENIDLVIDRLMERFI
ncbi:MAG: radical SAM protein [Candidatus Thorarchaeota archaeon]|nr:radical SAM protein [Candidatus Thorarchaeota archaeon]